MCIERDQRIPCLQIEDFRRLVSAGRSQLRPIRRPCDVHDPVSVIFDRQQLLARRNFEYANRAIRAGTGELCPVRAECDGEDRIVSADPIAEQLTVLDVENLHFTELRRCSRSDVQSLAVDAKFEVIDSFGNVPDTAHDGTIGGIPQHNFVIARCRQQ